MHTLTHPSLTVLDEKEIIRQVECDRQRLEEFFNLISGIYSAKPIRSFYFKGFYIKRLSERKMRSDGPFL